MIISLIITILLDIFRITIVIIMKEHIIFSSVIFITYDKRMHKFISISHQSLLLPRSSSPSRTYSTITFFSLYFFLHSVLLIHYAISSPYFNYSFIWLFFNSFFFIKATHLYNHKTTTKTFVWKNFDQGWALSRGVWMTSFVMPYLW